MEFGHADIIRYKDKYCIFKVPQYISYKGPASLNYCLQITFANRLDPDQAKQSVRSDLDPNCSTL